MEAKNEQGEGEVDGDGDGDGDGERMVIDGEVDGNGDPRVGRLRATVPVGVGEKSGVEELRTAGTTKKNTYTLSHQTLRTKNLAPIRTPYLHQNSSIALASMVVCVASGFQALHDQYPIPQNQIAVR